MSNHLMPTPQRQNITSITLDQINAEAGIQTRARLNDPTVKEYAERFRSGQKFAPMTAFQDGPNGPYVIVDGFHRLAAARRAGLKEVLVEIRQGNRDAAIKAALSANTDHGLRRTSADKRRCVALALSEFPDQSDRSLAEMCAVDKSLVADVRHQVGENATCPPAKRIGRDGKTYSLPNSAGTSTVASAPAGSTSTHGSKFQLVVAALSTLQTAIAGATSEHPALRKAIAPILRAMASGLESMQDGTPTCPASMVSPLVVAGHVAQGETLAHVDVKVDPTPATQCVSPAVP
jgi:hypothetical protein